MELAAFSALASVALAALKLRSAIPLSTGSPKAAKGTGELVFFDPNCPHDAEGHVHHLHVKAGEVANRILSVGDMGRADRIARSLDYYGTDDAGAPIRIVAPRGFITTTGTYKGVRVTIIATGMGVPMMDFAVREARACVTGPMAMLRYGTCGGLRDTKPGSVVVATEGTVLVRREGDLIAKKMAALQARTGAAVGGAGAMPEDDGIFPFSVSQVVKPDATLAALFKKHLETEITAKHGDAHEIVTGVNASADSFYSSQGRVNTWFYDFNEDVVDHLEATPGLSNLRCLEMETHHLYDLAACSRPASKIYAAGAAMVIANRHTNEGLDKLKLQELEELGGRAGLEALIEFKF